MMHEVRALARLHTGDAISVLAGIMNDAGEDARAGVRTAPHSGHCPGVARRL